MEQCAQFHNRYKVCNEIVTINVQLAFITNGEFYGIRSSWSDVNKVNLKFTHISYRDLNRNLFQIMILLMHLHLSAYFSSKYLNIVQLYLCWSTRFFCFEKQYEEFTREFNFFLPFSQPLCLLINNKCETSSSTVHSGDCLAIKEKHKNIETHIRTWILLFCFFFFFYFPHSHFLYSQLNGWE